MRTILTINGERLIFGCCGVRPASLLAGKVVSAYTQGGNWCDLAYSCSLPPPHTGFPDRWNVAAFFRRVARDGVAEWERRGRVG